MRAQLRRFPRLDLFSAGILLTPGDEPGEIPVAIQSLAPGGIGVRLSRGRRLIPGREGRLDFYLAGTAIRAQVRVVWCADGVAGFALSMNELVEPQKNALIHWYRTTLVRRSANSSTAGEREVETITRI